MGLYRLPLLGSPLMRTATVSGSDPIHNLNLRTGWTTTRHSALLQNLPPPSKGSTNSIPKVNMGDLREWLYRVFLELNGGSMFLFSQGPGLA